MGGKTLLRTIAFGGIVLLVFFVNWRGVAERWGEHKPDSPYRLALRNQTSLAINQIESLHKKVVKEIELRLEHEHRLFLYQFLLAAVVLGLVFGPSLLGTVICNFVGKDRPLQQDPLTESLKSGHLILFLGIAAIGLLIVNIHIRQNSLIINELGEWGQITYEQDNPSGWETYLAEYSLFHASRFLPIITAFLCLPSVVVLTTYRVLFGNYDFKCVTYDGLKTLHVIVIVGAHVCLLLMAFTVHWPFCDLSFNAWTWINASALVFCIGLIAADIFVCHSHVR